MVRMAVADFRKLKIKSSESKYHNRKTEYNGQIYDSKKEAGYAKLLDSLKKAKQDRERVIDWNSQIMFPLFVNEIKICTYILDFQVKYADGRMEYIDVKGYETEVFKLKAKLMKAIYDIDILKK